jgi:hypothetical protein
MEKDTVTNPNLCEMSRKEKLIETESGIRIS